MPTKNAVPNENDDLQPEYDLSTLTGGVRGKYCKRATAGTTLILLDERSLVLGLNQLVIPMNANNAMAFIPLN